MEGAVQLLSREGHTVSHNSKRHYHDAFVAMSRMRQRGLLCDIVLHVAAKEIRAHKVVLASCSPYFHAMFTSKYCPIGSGHLGDSAALPGRQTHVTLHDIDPQALDQLVQFAYTAEIVVGEGNVQTLLPAASLLQLNGVRDACCKFLLSQLDPSNCLGIRGFADTHSCSDLLKAAHRYVLQHFVDVAKTEEFMLLPLKQVLELVSSDSLNVPSEEDVYRAVLSWVKHDVDARRQHVPRALGGLRCLGGDAVAEDEACLGSSVPRGPPGVMQARGGSLFAIHGDCEAYDGTSDLATVESYDPVTNTWQPEVSMGTRRSCLGVAALHGLLYAAGGYDGASCLNRSWGRDCFAATARDGNLYAVGGYDSASHLATVEKYEPQVRSTPVTRSPSQSYFASAGVAVLEGALYVAGGNDGTSCLNSVERYSPKAGAW
ncbi:hypothetical protein E2I00_015819, partial [Balaenoptera physalus]